MNSQLKAAIPVEMHGYYDSELAQDLYTGIAGVMRVAAFTTEGEERDDLVTRLSAIMSQLTIALGGSNVGSHEDRAAEVIKVADKVVKRFCRKSTFMGKAGF